VGFFLQPHSSPVMGGGGTVFLLIPQLLAEILEKMMKLK
jgi:hypothetical protein